VIECRRKKATVQRAQSAGSSRRTVVAPADNSKFRARCQSAMSRRTHQRTSSAQQQDRHAAMYGQHQISTYKHTLSRPTPLLHTQSNAIESFLPKNYGFRDTRRYPPATGLGRVRALNQMSSIINDTGYFRRPETAAAPIGAATRMTAEDLVEHHQSTGQCWRNEMVADGWSGYNKYKQMLKRAGSILNHGPPSKPKMKLFLRHKAYDEATVEMVKLCEKSPRRARVVRKVLMSWQMAYELQAIIVWIDKLARDERIAETARIVPHIIGPVVQWLCSSELLRPIGRWRLNMYACYQAEQDREQAVIRAQAAAVQAEKDAQQAEIAKFARDFLNAIDDNGDGILGLVELKSAHGQWLSEQNPLFEKAALWLQYDRNYQKFDTNGGSEGNMIMADLISAMDVFLDENWKYDGILW